jgi:hypothetical protein
MWVVQSGHNNPFGPRRDPNKDYDFNRHALKIYGFPHKLKDRKCTLRFVLASQTPCC